MTTTKTIDERFAEANDALDEHAQYIQHPDAPHNPHALAVAAAAETFRDVYALVVHAAPIVEFVVDCPRCGEPASAGTTLFADWEPGKPLRIDVDLAASQTTFTCTDSSCAVESYTGDLDVHSEEVDWPDDTEDDDTDTGEAVSDGDS